MKRVYTKPDLFCEEYELSVEIAGNCSQNFSNSVNHNNPYKCTYDMLGETIFHETNKACSPNTGLYEDDMFCYQPSDGDKIVFAS